MSFCVYGLVRVVGVRSKKGLGLGSFSTCKQYGYDSCFLDGDVFSAEGVGPLWFSSVWVADHGHIPPMTLDCQGVRL